MNWPQIFSILGISSVISGFIGAFFQTKFQHSKDVKKQLHDLKEKRYLCLNLLLLAKVEAGKGMGYKPIRPDLHSEAALDKEIETELFNALIFANDDVISSLKIFITNPSFDTYYTTAIAMRKNLWGNNTSLRKIR